MNHEFRIIRSSGYSIHVYKQLQPAFLHAVPFQRLLAPYPFLLLNTAGTVIQSAGFSDRSCFPFKRFAAVCRNTPALVSFGNAPAESFRRAIALPAGSSRKPGAILLFDPALQGQCLQQTKKKLPYLLPFSGLRLRVLAGDPGTPLILREGRYLPEWHRMLVGALSPPFPQTGTVPGDTAALSGFVPDRLRRLAAEMNTDIRLRVIMNDFPIPESLPHTVVSGMALYVTFLAAKSCLGNGTGALLLSYSPFGKAKAATALLRYRGNSSGSPEFLCRLLHKGLSPLGAEISFSRLPNHLRLTVTVRPDRSSTDPDEVQPSFAVRCLPKDPEHLLRLSRSFDLLHRILLSGGA